MQLSQTFNHFWEARNFAPPPLRIVRQSLSLVLKPWSGTRRHDHQLPNAQTSLQIILYLHVGSKFVSWAHASVWLEDISGAELHLEVGDIYLFITSPRRAHHHCLHPFHMLNALALNTQIRACPDFLMNVKQKAPAHPWSKQALSAPLSPPKRMQTRSRRSHQQPRPATKRAARPRVWHSP